MKTWLVTGCSSGIGTAIARTALECGDNVVVTARSTDKVAEIVRKYPETACAMALDVTDRSSMTAAVAAAKARFGQIDVLVNNAGHGYGAKIEEGQEDEIQELFQTNFFGPLQLIRMVLPEMRARRSGAIVNISSISAVRGVIGAGYYAAAKAALELATDSLGKEVAPFGIKVMIVEPGAFRTRFYDTSFKSASRQIDYSGGAAVTGPVEDVSKLRHILQQGDPEKAGKCIVEAIGLDHPPKRLLMGSDAFRIVSVELVNRLREVLEEQDLSRTTDYTD